MHAKPGYKQTELGLIPDDWQVKSLGDLKPFVTSGSRGWANFYSDRGSLFVRITNMSRDSIYLDLERPKFVNLPAESSEGIRTQLQNHDLLISITADIGIVSYVDPQVPTPAYINQHIALVRFDQMKTCGKYVSYFLASERPQRLFRASTDTGAKAGMSLPTVQKIEVALPPLPEQRAIATALSDVDGLLGALDRLIAKKRDLKQAAMQQLLTGQTRLPGFKGEWVVKSFEQLYSETSRNGIYKTSDFQGRGTRIVNMGEMFGYDFISGQEMNRVSLTTKELATNGLHNGDLLFGRRSVVPSGAGKCSIVLNPPEPLTFESSIIRVRLSQEIAAPLFYYYYFASPIGRSIMTSIISGTNVKGIRGTELRDLRIPHPPLPEQSAIAEVLSEMDAELVVLEQRREKTRAIKQGMMQELLTGKTRLA